MTYSFDSTEILILVAVSIFVGIFLGFVIGYAAGRSAAPGLGTRPRGRKPYSPT